jgi:hypothetical protein
MTFSHRGVKIRGQKRGEGGGEKSKKFQPEKVTTLNQDVTPTANFQISHAEA